MSKKPTEFDKSEKQKKQPGKESKMHEKPEVIRETYRGSGKLDGKVALITGGDSGIGRAVAVHFAREGADVAIVYLDEDKDAKDTQQIVEAEGRKCITIKGDVKEETFCQKAIEQTRKELGGLNILVNNAAQQFPTEDVQEVTPEQVQKTFETNIFPYFYFAREALKTMKKGDCIINTTSITAYRGSHHLLDYSSTKGAIVSFNRSLAANLAEKGIRVNGVAPGPIWTPLIVSSFKGKKIESFGQDVPMKRAGQPSEVAPAYVFLASEDASYITGQVIHVNGGDFLSS